MADSKTKNYLLLISVQGPSDAEIIAVAAKTAAFLNEYVQVNLGRTKSFDVTPEGGVLIAKKRLLLDTSGDLK